MKHELSIWWQLTRAEAALVIRSGRFLSLVGMAAVLAIVFVTAAGLQYGEVRSAPMPEKAGAITSGAGELGNVRAVRPAVPLAMFVRGLDDSVPAVWTFSASGPQPVSSAASPSLSPLDLVFLVRVLIGLLAVMIAVDRAGPVVRSGPLRALLSQPIQPSLVVLIKISGAAAALTVATGVIALAAAAAARVSGAASGPGIHLALTLAAFACASLGYAIVLYAIGVVMACAARDVNAATAAALSAWVAIGLVLPALANGLADRQSRQPESAAADRQREYGADVLRVERELGVALVAALKPGERPNDALQRPEVRRQLEQIWLSAARERRQRLDSEIARSTNRSFPARWSFDPGTQYAAVAAALAGTGPRLVEEWQWALRNQQRALSEEVFDNPARLIARVTTDAGREVLSFPRELTPAGGRFDGREPAPVPFDVRLRDAAAPMAVLFAMAAVSLAVAGWRFSTIR